MIDPLSAAALSQLGFAFSLGAATFFAPCSYPLLPGYVAYYLGSSEEKPATGGVWRAVLVGVVVSAGFFLVYGALGGVVALIGSGPLSNISVLELVVGSILVVLGAVMAMGWSPNLHVQLPMRKRSYPRFFLFGVVYAGAAAGCTAPIFIAVSIRGLTAGPTMGALTLIAYAAGMSVLMVALTVLAGLGRSTILRRFSRQTGRISRAAGVLLIGAGLLQIYLFLFEFNGFAIFGLS